MCVVFEESVVVPGVLISSVSDTAVSRRAGGSSPPAPGIYVIETCGGGTQVSLAPRDKVRGNELRG
jgi:hypothetical protein